MKQAYVSEPGKIIYRDVDKPVIKPGMVIIKVSRIGICGSDVHVFKGKHPVVSPPAVPGHEFGGYVEEIGEGVSGLKKGDLVTIEPAIGCGSCRACKEGLFAQCDNLRFVGGIGISGGGSQYFMIQAEQVVKMPENATPDDAAMVEPLAVAVHSVSKVPNIEGKDVLVTGAGTIGNLIAQVAKVFKAKNVIVSEIMPARIEIAKRCGFSVINPAKVDSFDEELKKYLSGEPLSIAFECSGNGNALNTCIKVVSRGGYVIVAGVYESGTVDTEMVLVQDKELNLIGTLMYTWNDYHKAIDIIAENKVNLKILQTHHFKFDRWIDGYNLLTEKSNDAVKVLIDMD